MKQSDDDCSGIIGKRVLLAWVKKMPPTQIAKEQKLKLKLVMEILKREQKKIVEQGKTRYGEESKS